LRLVDLQVVVEEDEHAALERFLQELLRHVVQALEGIRRADDELDRQADAARQRRRLEGDDPRACDILVQLLLDQRLQRVGG
jgi:hypothetical protein